MDEDFREVVIEVGRKRIGIGMGEIRFEGFGGF